MAHAEREEIAKPRFDSRPDVKYELRDNRSLTTPYAGVRIRGSAVPLAGDKHRSAAAIRFTTVTSEFSVSCASADVKNTKRLSLYFLQKSPGKTLVVESCKRPAIFLTCDYVHWGANYIPANACLLVSPSDFGSLLRVFTMVLLCFFVRSLLS